ncbi:MAG: thiamine ABC transporter substrate-binding protein [Actinomycetaceae bacterium]|nr:thiamine ABC transporter substrate-binding protein [Actinomycetaceae bacterium]
MKRVWTGIGAAAAAALLLAGCSSSAPQAGTGSEATELPVADVSEVVVVSYDSMEIPEDVIAKFKEETGYELTVSQLGSGGELVSQLVLSKENPLGDVAFGIDNLSAYRAIEEGVFADDAPELQAWATEQQIDGAPGLVPFDQGDVCINVDHEWFAENNLEEPATLDDLADPKYKDLLVAMNPTSSSPGLAFFAATVGAYGDDWTGYWEKLRDNGVKITKGWSDAFEVDYTAGEGDGNRPMMVSYASSPAYSVNEEMTESSTGALLDTCFHQVEYTGVLAGAKNPEGAKAFIDFMLQVPQQEMISEANYMHPINPDANAPEALAKFGQMSDNPHQVDPKTLAENQQDWLLQWTEIMGN